MHVNESGARVAETRAVLATVNKQNKKSQRGRNHVGSHYKSLTEQTRVAHEHFIIRPMNHFFVGNVEQQRRSLHIERATTHLHPQPAIGLIGGSEGRARVRENQVSLRVQHHDSLIFHPQSEKRGSGTPFRTQNRIVRVEIGQVDLGVLPNVDRVE